MDAGWMRAATAVAASALVWLAGCDDGGSAAPQAAPVPAPAVAATSGPPAVAFSPLILDLGELSETETRSGVIAFTNTGGGTLVIRDVKSSCGCTVPALAKKEYAPGETGEISVRYDPSAPGEPDKGFLQKQTITVLTNASEVPQRLEVHAHVRPFVSIEPRFLDFATIAAREPHVGLVDVRFPDESFEILAVSMTNPHTAARVVPGAGPLDRRIEVTVAPTAPWGGLISWLEVQVRGRPAPGAEPILHKPKVRVQAKIFGKVMGEPEAFRFGVERGERFERVVVLRHADGAMFTVTRATVVDSTLPKAEVVAAPQADGTWKLTLVAVGGDLPRQYSAKVVVETDVPGDERIEIEVIGVVRPPPPP